MVSFAEEFSLEIEARRVRLSIRLNESTVITKIVSIDEFRALVGQFETKLLEADAI